MGEFIKIVGCILGILAFIIQVFIELKSYLKIKVQVIENENYFSALTEVENTSIWKSKDIDNAFLIISPEFSDLIETGEKISRSLKLNAYIENTNDFEGLFSETPIYFDKKYAFIPLDFYYSENVSVGNERLAYRCSVDKSKFVSGNYSVRFYIYGGKNRLHRSSQDLMMIK